MNAAIAIEKKTVIRRIADIKTTFFVRKQLNRPYACELAELQKNGVKLNPIEITEDDELIDGRHRMEAHTINGIEVIECVVIEGEFTEADLISRAYQCNTGGSMPPSRADTEHTIGLLLERGVTHKRIGELLGLPKAMARSYIDQVRSRINRMNLQRAAAAVANEGMTLPDAAAKFKVDLAALKTLIAGGRRKQKKGVGEIKLALTASHKSMAARNARLLRQALDLFTEGEINAEGFEEVLNQLEEHATRHQRTIQDWRNRFVANGGVEIEDEAPKKKRRSKKAAA
jgi:hypothetical protein